MRNLPKHTGWSCQPISGGCASASCWWCMAACKQKVNLITGCQGWKGISFIEDTHWLFSKAICIVFGLSLQQGGHELMTGWNCQSKYFPHRGQNKKITTTGPQKQRTPKTCVLNRLPILKQFFATWCVCMSQTTLQQKGIYAAACTRRGNLGYCWTTMWLMIVHFMPRSMASPLLVSSGLNPSSKNSVHSWWQWATLHPDPSLFSWWIPISEQLICSSHVNLCLRRKLMSWPHRAMTWAPSQELRLWPENKRQDSHLQLWCLHSPLAGSWSMCKWNNWFS